jgi:hypothetical protein
MTTAITKLQTGQQLTELELMIMEEAEQEEHAFDLIPTRIKIAPGGINNFVTDGKDVFSEIIGIVAVSQKTRGYWAGKGKESPAPLCSSPDGARGHFAIAPNKKQLGDAVNHRTVHPAIRIYDELREFPDFFDCASCPLNQWGSADEGNGKACKEMRRLVLILNGWVAPALLTLPPTSIRVWDTFCSGLKNKRSAYFAVRVKLTLSDADSRTGDPYSILSVSIAGSLTQEEVQAVMELRRQFAEYVRELPIESADYATPDNTQTIDPETGEIHSDASQIPF